MPGRAVWILVALSACGACDGSAEQPQGKVVLAVSAGHDLGRRGTGAERAGSGAYAADLVSLPEGGQGPFEYDDAASTDVMLVLRPRSVSAIDEIRIHAVAQNDEWRMLHGRTIDVIPTAHPIFVEMFEELESVRIVDLPSSSVYALYFNPHDSTLADPDVRRGIVSKLSVDGIARIACASDDCARPLWTFSLPSAPVRFPTQLTLSHLSNDASAAAAARVIRLQLAEVGVDVTVTALRMNELLAVVGPGEYQLVLQPMASEDLLLTFASPSFFGYDGAAYDASIESGDSARIGEVLRDQALVAPLYEVRAFAAIDEQWCGGDPVDQTSWLWLADLYPCGDTQ